MWDDDYNGRDDFNEYMMYHDTSGDTKWNYRPGSTPCLLAIVIYIIVGFVLAAVVMAGIGVDSSEMPDILMLIVWGICSYIAGLVLKQFGWY